MAGINAAFHRLQVIAFLQALGDETLRWLNLGPFQRRRWRLQDRRSQIGPDDSGLFDARVGFQLDVPPEAALFGFRWKIDALPGHVVLPAVIGATQPAFLVLTKPER